MIKSPKQIKSYLDSIVIGQHEAKIDLAINGYRHVLQYYKDTNKHLNRFVDPPQLNMLIVGPSGTGKTLMIKTFAEYMDFPFFIIDACNLTNLSADGADIREHFHDYYKQYHGHDKIDYGIIFIDEFDKLGLNYAQGWDKKVQASLLTILENTLTHVRRNDGTKGSILHPGKTNFMFVLGGAFSDLTKAIDRDERFHCPKKTKEDIKRKLVVEGGIIRELFNRIHIVTYTKHLSSKEIEDVLFNCRNSIFSQFQSWANLSDTSQPLLRLTRQQKEYIIKEVEKSGNGMRQLTSLLFETFKDKLFSLEFKK